MAGHFDIPTPLVPFQWNPPFAQLFRLTLRRTPKPFFIGYSFSSMKPRTLLVVKHLPLSDIIVFRWPKVRFISFCTNFKTLSEVSVRAGHTIGQAVKYSTAISRYLSPSLPGERTRKVYEEGIEEASQRKAHDCPVPGKFFGFLASKAASNILVDS